jgi:hypothetical protein
MPNKTTTSRARVGKQSNEGGFKFRWWMAAGLVVVVVLVGVLVLRYSKAAGGTVAQFGGSDCTRVNLTHLYSKGSSVTNNVCEGKVDPEGSFLYDTSVLTGRPATYCVWGRYYTKNSSDSMDMWLVVWDTQVANRVQGPISKHLGRNSGISGYGSNFTANPGGNVKLACVNTSSPNVGRFQLNAVAVTANGNTHSDGLVFLDQITVEY